MFYISVIHHQLWRDKSIEVFLLYIVKYVTVNTLRPRQNGRHFTDDIFKCIFLNENAGILLKISLKFVPKVRINNIPALVQIMAWRRPGDKPLSEPMMVSLLTHICVTRPQWVKAKTLLHLYFSELLLIFKVKDTFEYVFRVTSFSDNFKLLLVYKLVFTVLELFAFNTIEWWKKCL